MFMFNGGAVQQAYGYRLVVGGVLNDIHASRVEKWYSEMSKGKDKLS